MDAATSLRDRVLAAAAATPSLTRRQGRRLARLLIGLSGAIAVALFVAVGGLSHLREAVLVGNGRLAEGWGLAAAAFACLLLDRGRSTIVRSPELFAAATWASPVVMLLWVARFDRGEASFREALECLALTVAIAATPLASFVALRRGAEPRCPRTLGAAAGAMCGACAQTVVLLWHPVTSLAFATVAHALPLAALAALGGIAGDRWLGSPEGGLEGEEVPSYQRHSGELVCR
jgi:hypothetical protein